MNRLHFYFWTDACDRAHLPVLEDLKAVRLHGGRDPIFERSSGSLRRTGPRASIGWIFDRPGDWLIPSIDMNPDLALSQRQREGPQAYGLDPGCEGASARRCSQGRCIRRSPFLGSRRQRQKSPAGFVFHRACGPIWGEARVTLALEADQPFRMLLRQHHCTIRYLYGKGEPSQRGRDMYRHVSTPNIEEKNPIRRVAAIAHIEACAYLRK